jgi:hypothetical protein
MLFCYYETMFHLSIMIFSRAINSISVLSCIPKTRTIESAGEFASGGFGSCRTISPVAYFHEQSLVTHPGEVLRRLGKILVVHLDHNAGLYLASLEAWLANFRLMLFSFQSRSFRLMDLRVVIWTWSFRVIMVRPRSIHWPRRHAAQSIGCVPRSLASTVANRTPAFPS